MAEGLLRHSIDEGHRKIKAKIGEATWDNLGHARQIGVMDYCFHHGNIDDFAEHLKAGDFRKVAAVMLKDAEKPAFKARAELRSDYVYYNTLHFDGVHIVWSGETFGGVAKKHGISVEELKELNPQLGKNLGKLSVGQKIYINDDAAEQFQTGAHQPSPADMEGDQYSQSEEPGYFQRAGEWLTSWFVEPAHAESPSFLRETDQENPLLRAWKFESKGSYDLNTPAWDTYWVNEPIWLYTPQSYFAYANTAADPMKGFSLVRDMKREVQACLGNPACTDTTERLIHRVLQSRPELKDPTSLHDSLQRVAQEAAAGFSDPQGEMLFNLFRKSELGQWAHPLREELKYAASHVSPLVLDLDGNGIKLLPYTRGVYFDIDNDGFAERVGWAMPEEGQLARDLNANGRIDDITELFWDGLIRTLSREDKEWT